jgi:hypothetical protein
VSRVLEDFLCVYTTFPARYMTIPFAFSVFGAFVYSRLYNQFGDIGRIPDNPAESECGSGVILRVEVYVDDQTIDPDPFMSFTRDAL